MGKLGTALNLVLQFAAIAQMTHAAGADKKTMVLTLAKQFAPLALQKAGHDAGDAEELVDHAFTAFEHSLAFAKGLKK